MVTRNQLLTLYVGYHCYKYIEFHKNYLWMNLSQAINATIVYEGYPTSLVDYILNQVVSSDTQENYANHNVDLVLWIYEKEK